MCFLFHNLSKDYILKVFHLETDIVQVVRSYSAESGEILGKLYGRVRIGIVDRVSFFQQTYSEPLNLRCISKD